MNLHMVTRVTKTFVAKIVQTKRSRRRCKNNFLIGEISRHKSKKISIKTHGLPGLPSDWP